MKYCILTFCLLIGMLNASYSQINEADSLAMVDFYHAADGDNWENNTNWLTAEPMSEWYGLSISNGRIIGISMRNNSCSGYINSSFGDCTELKNIFLEENEITGFADFDSLHQLTRLNLYQNKITEFPAFIVKCHKLEQINLFDNAMEGNIPAGLNNLSQLDRLYLTKNKLSGTVPSLRSLKKLLYFDLSQNLALKGDLKDILYDSLQLETLTFSVTGISGEILPSYFNEESTSLRLFADSSKVSRLDQLADLEFSRLWIRHTDLNFNQLLAVQDQNNINVFYYQPQNLVPSEANVNVALGAELALTCNIEGAEELRWFKDGQVIQGESSAELVITDFTMDDAGEYLCTGYHSVLPLLNVFQDTTTVAVGPTNTSEYTLESLQIFPNPSSDFLKIENAQGKNAAYHIYNKQGQLCNKGLLNQNTVNIQDLAPGVYTLMILEVGSNKGPSQKFIKI